MRRTLVENELLERAAKLFASQGFRSTTLQEIADAMEVSRPALYYYVTNKDELLSRVVTGFIRDTVNGVRNALAPDDPPADQLRTVLLHLLVSIFDQPDRFKLLDSARDDLPADLAAEQSRAEAEIIGAVEQILQKGISEGSFRAIDIPTTARAILGMVNSVARWHDRSDGTLRDPSQDVVQLALAAVCSTPSSGVLSSSPHEAIDRMQAELDRLRLLL
jgi:AcrR family transcriptional regulator